MQLQMDASKLHPSCPSLRSGCRCEVPLCSFNADDNERRGMASYMMPMVRCTCIGMTYLCARVMQVITNEEAERRGKLYDSSGMTYLLDLDYFDSEAVFTVDAGIYGNLSHFVNHSVGFLEYFVSILIPLV